MTVPEIPPSQRPPSRDGNASGRDLTTLSRQEFVDLVQRHSRALWALAAGTLGRPDEIEDVLQEATMIGLQKLDQFERGTSFAAWMGRVVRLVALNRARLRQRRQTEATDPVVLDQAVASPVAAPAIGMVAGSGEVDFAGLADQVDDDLLRAIGRLQPKPRACLLLRALADLDYEAIGELLGLRSGTAMSHVHRARAELQRTLGVSHGVAAARSDTR
jgi:RNA polymerase sigma-70 factor (ECF subfamily)